MISGVINVLKPAGVTSNYVVTQIKKKIKPNKIGHLGTLDPSGVGVLPVCINKATKLFDYYLKKDKEYKTVFVFGKETDTLDSDGRVLSVNAKEVNMQDIEAVIPKLVGKVSQMPPKYSAKKVNGKAAYELARDNIQFDLKPKEIEIYSIKPLEKLDDNMFLFDIRCSSGTYIRSIVRDMAQLLNTVGYMAAIIRVVSGNFNIENSVLLDEVSEHSIIPIQNVLKDWAKVFINDKLYDKIINGNYITTESKDLDKCVVFCKNELIGIGHINSGLLKIDTMLRE